MGRPMILVILDHVLNLLLRRNMQVCIRTNAIVHYVLMIMMFEFRV